MDGDSAASLAFTLHPEREDTGRRAQDTGRMKGGTFEIEKGQAPPLLWWRSLGHVKKGELLLDLGV